MEHCASIAVMLGGNASGHSPRCQASCSGTGNDSREAPYSRAKKGMTPRPQCCQSVLLILRSLRKFWVLNRSLNPEQKRQLAIVQFGSFKPGKRVRPKTLFGGNCRYALII